MHHHGILNLFLMHELASDWSRYIRRTPAIFMQEWLIVIFGYNKKLIWGNFSAYFVSDLYNPQLQWILLFFIPLLSFALSLLILILGMDVFIVFLMVSVLMRGGGGGGVVPHFFKVFFGLSDVSNYSWQNQNPPFQNLWPLNFLQPWKKMCWKFQISLYQKK